MDNTLIIFLTLVFSAFFSGMEIAFVSANKLRVELDKKQGRITARIISKFLKSPGRFIGTMLVGNNIALVIYGTVMAAILEPYIRRYIPQHYISDLLVLTIQTLLSTLLILVTAEFLPKALFRIHPNHILNFLAIPVFIIYWILYPVVILIIGLSEIVLGKIFNMEFSEDKPVFGRIDLDHYIRDVAARAHQESEVKEEIRIFQNALDFTRVKVRECMVPRTEMVAVEVTRSVETLRQKFSETKLSRIFIYRGTIDNIIGFTHIFELFKNPETIESILLPVSVVPETMPANELLTLFTQQHKSIAVVVDEFGGTSGIATMEDVMEEILGEIDDEHDVDEKIEKQINANEFIFSGRHEVDDLNGKYHLNIPESPEYETLAGFIFHHHENIPEINEEIIIPPFRITALKVTDTRIEQVKLVVESTPENGEL